MDKKQPKNKYPGEKGRIKCIGFVLVLLFLFDVFVGLFVELGELLGSVVFKPKQTLLKQV